MPSLLYPVYICVYGNEIVNGTLIQLATAEGRTDNVLSEAYNNAWRPDAQSNSYPRVGYLGESGSPAITDRIIEDGSFLRISTVSYTHLTLPTNREV